MLLHVHGSLVRSLYVGLQPGDSPNPHQGEDSIDLTRLQRIAPQSKPPIRGMP